MSGSLVVSGESAGGGGGGDPPPEEGGGGTADASIAAEGTAFDTASLSWPADTEVTLTFDNRDDAAVAGQHNVSIYDGDTALFQGELISGPATVDYVIPPLEPGTYEFRCDVHPTMIGTVEVT
jgi:plastocyanin